MWIFCLVLLFGDVQNPEHVKGTIAFELMHQWGDSAGEDFLFWGPQTTIAVADDGVIGVLDRDQNRLIALSATGEKLWMAGGKGQGPGEFMGAGDVVYFDQAFHVFDNVLRKVSSFLCKDGHLNDEVVLPIQTLALIQPDRSQNGIILTSLQMDANFQQTYITKLFNSNWEHVSDLESQALPPVDWTKMGQPGFYEDYLAKQYEAIGKGFPQGVAVGSNFFVASPSSYQGKMVDASGNVLFEMTKEHRPMRYSEGFKEQTATVITDNIRMAAPFGNELTTAVQDRALSKNTFPDFVQPIQLLVKSDDGFAVLRDFDPTKGKGVLDFFKADGTCYASGNYPGLGGDMLIRGDIVYDCGTDQDEEVVLRVYKMKR